MVSSLFSQKWSLLALLIVAAVSSVSGIRGYYDSEPYDIEITEREETLFPKTRLPFGLCDEHRRRPTCTGPPSGGCGCNNSTWQCKDGFDSLTTCPGGECAVSIEGNPVCTGALSGQCEKECKSSADCGGGSTEACVWVGKTRRTDCVQEEDYFCPNSFVCAVLA